MTWYQMYLKNRTQDRDYAIGARIQDWIQKNMLQGLADGIIRHVPILTGSFRDHLTIPYNLSDEDWSDITDTLEFFKIKKIGSVKLKIGLICSYIDTQNPIFLKFMSILTYTGRYQHYFRNGHDPNVMEYAIQSQTNLSQFKKLGSLWAVMEEKHKYFIKNFEKWLSPKIKDKEIREMIQSLETRWNQTVRIIARDVHAVYDSDEIKILKKYSKTADGKVEFSPGTVFSMIREKAVDSIAYPNEKILGMLALGPTNVAKMKYRVAIGWALRNHFPELAQITGTLIDVWSKKNSAKGLSIREFRNKFVTQMINSRQITQERNTIDKIARNTSKALLESEREISLDIVDLKGYLYKYILANIRLAAMDI